MTTTQNLHLPQWEKTDRIMMDDFNDAMSKIDAAISAIKIATGSYTGDGAESRTISLDFTPKAVFVCPNTGRLHSLTSYYHYYGGLAVENSPVIFPNNNYSYLSITAGGFMVTYKYHDPNNATFATNESDIIYNYIAIG